MTSQAAASRRFKREYQSVLFIPCTRDKKVLGDSSCPMTVAYKPLRVRVETDANSLCRITESRVFYKVTKVT
ncbi:hypothetical protein ANTQUA_LOCUS5535 [Anthophora quadrimaculata]